MWNSKSDYTSSSNLISPASDYIINHRKAIEDRETQLISKTDKLKQLHINLTKSIEEADHHIKMCQNVPGIGEMCFLKSDVTVIFIVDDEKISRMILKELLDRDGIRIIEAKNKSEIDFILNNEHRIDFIFLDIYIPGIEPRSNFDDIIKSHKESKIYLYTSCFKDDPDVVYMTNKGAIFIEKYELYNILNEEIDKFLR